MVISAMETYFNELAAFSTGHFVRVRFTPARWMPRCPISCA